MRDMRVEECCNPAAHVTAYFALAPEVVASAQTLETRFAILRRRNHRENERLAASAAGGPLPDVPAAFHELEVLEHDYWVAFARAKASVDGTSEEEQRRLVESAMRRFRDEEARKIVPPVCQAPQTQAARHAATVEVPADECVFPLLVPRRADRRAPRAGAGVRAESAHDGRAHRGGDPFVGARSACVVDTRRHIGPTGTVVMASGAMALNATIAAEQTSFPEAPATVEEPSTPLPTLTAAQHAEVLAHVMFGGGHAIFARCGVEDAGVRQRVLDSWARRLKRSPVETEQWNRLYADAISTSQYLLGERLRHRAMLGRHRSVTLRPGHPDDPWTRMEMGGRLPPFLPTPVRRILSSRLLHERRQDRTRRDTAPEHLLQGREVPRRQPFEPGYCLQEDPTEIVVRADSART